MLKKSDYFLKNHRTFLLMVTNMNSNPRQAEQKKSLRRSLYVQVARKSSRPKSCRPKPESCRPKFIVMSPDILSHVARNFIMLKDSKIASQSEM